MQDITTLLRKRVQWRGRGEGITILFSSIQFSSVQFRIKLYGGSPSSRHWVVGGRRGVAGVGVGGKGCHQALIFLVLLQGATRP